MRTLLWLSGWVLWGLATVGVAADSGTIVIENGGQVEFCFTLRLRAGEPWSEPIELEPGQRHVLETSIPVVVSYWTDQARFLTLEPGGRYRVDDPRNGLLRPVTGEQESLAADEEPSPEATTNGVSGPSVDDAGRRVLRLSAIADTTYRQVVDDWRERIRQTVAGASAYYEKNFQIRLVLDEIRPWEYRGLVDTVEGRIEQVLQVSPEPSELLVAFVGFGEYYKVEEQAFLTGHLGVGLPFGQHLLVTGNDDYHVNREIAVLIHELAHVFGAFHVADRRSLMQPVYEDAPLREILGDHLPLDAVSTAILRLTREVDFRRGVMSLDAATRRQLTQLADRHRHPTEAYGMSPVGTGHLYRHLLSRARTAAETARPSADAPADNDLKAGDKVLVTAQSVPISDEGTLLANVPQHTTLTVLQVADDRLFVAWEPPVVKGWLRADQLMGRSAAVAMSQGQHLWTVEEAELLSGSHLLSVLPPGVRVAVQRVADDLVLVTVQRQVLAQYKGGNLIFEPVLEGWIDRSHVRRQSAQAAGS